MLFNQALGALRLQKYVTRTAWTDGKYLALLPFMPFIWQVATVPNPAAGNWVPLAEDLESNDWEWVEEVIARAKAASAEADVTIDAA